jgi:GNAT superfamily N-acetyltransferase
VTVLARRDDGLVIDDDPDRVDLAATFAMVVGEGYWATSRTPESVAASVRGSWVFGVYDGGAQIGFARAVTDRATFAWICDVIVTEAYRGRGIGSWLVATVLDAVEATGVPRQLLATRDAHEVYARQGFTPLVKPETWMERDRRPPG